MRLLVLIQSEAEPDNLYEAGVDQKIIQGQLSLSQHQITSLMNEISKTMTTEGTSDGVPKRIKRWHNRVKTGCVTCR